MSTIEGDEAHAALRAHIVDLEAKLAAAQALVARREIEWRQHRDLCIEAQFKSERERHWLEDRITALVEERDALRATLAQAREALGRVVEFASRPRPLKDKYGRVIAHVLDEEIEAIARVALAALDVRKGAPLPLQTLQDWALAYTALASGRTAEESKQRELEFNSACERLYEALDAGKT